MCFKVTVKKYDFFFFRDDTQKASPKTTQPLAKTKSLNVKQRRVHLCGWNSGWSRGKAGVSFSLVRFT